MTPASFTCPSEGSHDFQAELSEIADSGAAPTPALRDHLERCDDCARFAAQWLPGPPAGLARPVSAAPVGPLREQILDAATPPRIIRWPASPARRIPGTAWLGRIAAGLAIGGLSYWLLNPTSAPVHDHPATASAPTLSQGLARMEGESKHEQAVLQTALVDGGREVRGNVAWSVSALDL